MAGKDGNRFCGIPRCNRLPMSNGTVSASPIPVFTGTTLTKMFLLKVSLMENLSRKDFLLNP
jgi:hypothetical protein